MVASALRTRIETRRADADTALKRGRAFWIGAFLALVGGAVVWIGIAFGAEILSAVGLLVLIFGAGSIAQGMLLFLYTDKELRDWDE